MAKKADETLRTEIGDLDDNDIRTRIQRSLIERRKLKLDAAAYASAARDAVKHIEIDLEACLDEVEARTAKKAATAAKPKAAGKTGAQAAA